MFHHNFFGLHALCCAIAVSSLFFSHTSFADDDNLLDRNRHAGRRNSKFYFKENQKRHFLSLSAEYDSDEDSKQKLAKVDHYYKSNSFISDTELTLDTIYEIQRKKNSKDKNKYLIKERDLFKLITSQKLSLFSTNNYFIFFNESRHDNESDYSYRDVVTSAGLGRSFQNQMIEIDFSFGQATGKNITDTTYSSSRKNYKRSVLVSSLRFERSFNKKIRLISRGYYYKNSGIKSIYSTIKLQYRIKRSIFLQISHLFDKRQYKLFNEKTSGFIKNMKETRRQVIFGLSFQM